MSNGDDKTAGPVPEPGMPPPAAAPTAPAPPAAPALPDPVEKAQRRARLLQVAGPGQLHAAVLALLLTPGRAREMAVWRDCILICC